MTTQLTIIPLSCPLICPDTSLMSSFYLSLAPVGLHTPFTPRHHPPPPQETSRRIPGSPSTPYHLPPSFLPSEWTCASMSRCWNITSLCRWQNEMLSWSFQTKFTTVTFAAGNVVNGCSKQEKMPNGGVKDSSCLVMMWTIHLWKQESQRCLARGNAGQFSSYFHSFTLFFRVGVIG